MCIYIYISIYIYNIYTHILITRDHGLAASQVLRAPAWVQRPQGASGVARNHLGDHQHGRKHHKSNCQCFFFNCSCYLFGFYSYHYD